MNKFLSFGAACLILSVISGANSKHLVNHNNHRHKTNYKRFRVLMVTI